MAVCMPVSQRICGAGLRSTMASGQVGRALPGGVAPCSCCGRSRRWIAPPPSGEKRRSSACPGRPSWPCSVLQIFQGLLQFQPALLEIFRQQLELALALQQLGYLVTCLAGVKFGGRQLFAQV